VQPTVRPLAALQACNGVTCSTAGHEPPRPDWDEVQALHYGGEAARGDRDGRHPKQIESEVGSHARDYNSSMRR